MESSGARYEKELSNYLAPLDAINSIVDNLSIRGFEPAVSPVLFEQVQKSGPSAKLRKAQEHLEWMVTQMAERGETFLPLQISALHFLLPRSAGLVSAKMGCGKAYIGAGSIPRQAPVLIVCPAVAKGNWERELKKLRPDLKPVILKGRKNFRWPKPNEALIINYEIQPRAERLVNHGDIKATRDFRLIERTVTEDGETYFIPRTDSPIAGTVVIMDELHRAKSATSIRGRSANVLCKVVRNGNGITHGTTATPILNHPWELKNILEILDLFDEAFSHNSMSAFQNFVRLFGGTKTGFRGSWEWAPPPELQNELVECLQRVSIRFTLQQVRADMPSKTVVEIPVDLDEPTTKQCDLALEEIDRVASEQGGLDKIIAMLAGIGVNYAEVMSVVNDTAVAGASFQELARAMKMIAIAKIPFAMDLIQLYEEAEERLVVFSRHRAPIDMLEGRDGWTTITGSVSAKKRSERIAAFQSGEIRNCAATIDAGGMAIDLTAASHALFIDRKFVEEDNEQAQDRVWRITQDHPVVINILVINHPLEDRLREIGERKKNLVRATIDAATITAIPAMPKITANLLLGSRAVISDEGPIPRQPSARRAARTEAERWAATAVRLLAEHDSDHALERNAQGFSPADSRRGRSLESKLGIGLTDAEWDLAISIAKKYPRQVGSAPQ